MREDPVVTAGTTLGTGPGDATVVALPNLVHGRLADLLAAASGPAQEAELRAEPEARAVFRAVSESWPVARRRLRRTPAVVAVTTMATMLVATTGLAAASQLPGSAGRTVQGLLGSVGISSPPPAPAPTPAPALRAALPAAGTAASGSPSTPGARRFDVGRVPCTVGGGATGVVTGGVQTASCTITPDRHTAVAAPAAVPATSARHATGRVTPPVGRSTTGRTHQGTATGGGTTGAGTGSQGGGSSRGGNLGGGTCGTTTTTDPDAPTTTTDPDAPTTTTDPTTTTTTDPTTAGCDGHGSGRHRAGGAGTTTTTTTTSP